MPQSPPNQTSSIEARQADPADDQTGGADDDGATPRYRIASGGFQADVESIAFLTKNQDTHLWFLSAVGTQQSCRTIAAKLLKQNPDNAALMPNRAAAQEDMPWHFNVRRSPECESPWTFSVKRLPASRAWHLLMLPQLALHNRQDPTFLLLSPDLKQPDEPRLAALHCDYLDQRTREPIHPSWADWIWRRALRTSEAARLPGTGRAAFLCQPDYDRLSLDISTALATGRLKTETE